jgi:hypothetical protein
MRLCSYVVRVDAGLAPNPFWGYCTLAVCTPNHQGIRAGRGDWVMGHSTARRGHRLIYAMRVSEVLSFDQYWGDPRFERKKPKLVRSWREACGDNIYHHGRSGEWIQGPSPFHNTPELLLKDTRHPRVFVSDHFYYFGEKAVEIPEAYAELIWPRQGCHWSCRPDLVDGFLHWLESSFALGVHGDPHDRATCLPCDVSVEEDCGGGPRTRCPPPKRCS